MERNRKENECKKCKWRVIFPNHLHIYVLDTLHTQKFYWVSLPTIIERRIYKPEFPLVFIHYARYRR